MYFAIHLKEIQGHTAILLILLHRVWVEKKITLLLEPLEFCDSIGSRMNFEFIFFLIRLQNISAYRGSSQKIKPKKKQTSLKKSWVNIMVPLEAKKLLHKGYKLNLSRYSKHHQNQVFTFYFLYCMLRKKLLKSNGIN